MAAVPPFQLHTDWTVGAVGIVVLIAGAGAGVVLIARRAATARIAAVIRGQVN